LQSGVLGSVKHCTGTWCRFVGDGFDGWIAQEQLWGVYPDEEGGVVFLRHAHR
jgi:SH3-like domain-containing protein